MTTAGRSAGGSEAPARGLDPARIRLPAIVLGVGMGGFIDGILLHLLLQWHRMLSGTDTDNIGVRYYPTTTVHGLRMNTIWDGVFHVVTWVAVLAGIALLDSRLRRGSRRRVWRSPVLWGGMLIGWGLFNLIEGILDHHLLGIHHVRHGPHQTWWDIGFLVFGALHVAGGWLLQRGATAAGARHGR